MSVDIQNLIGRGETADIEFKVALPRLSELAERLCGFANTPGGGTVVIGIEDKSWQIVGVKSSSDAIDGLLQAARLCKPAVRFVPALPQVVTEGGKEIVTARIAGNEGQLYQAGGVCWVRRGTYTVPLEVDEIERFLYNQGRLDWETQPTPGTTLSDLDDQKIQAYLEQRPSYRRSADRLADLERILTNIGCLVKSPTDSTATPTNAGLLLFGHHPQDFLLQAEVVCVLYGDELGLRRFADRRVLSGTLGQQIDQAEGWLRQYIAVGGEIEGFRRIDRPQYPLEALREAVVNALVHRDYSLKGEAVRIFFYANRIEIRNPGSLMPGLTLDNLQHGQSRSKPRNPVLVSVLRDLPGSYVERMGTGVPFMLNQMEALGGSPPRFSEQGEFVVTFQQLPGTNTTLPTRPVVVEAAATANKGVEGDLAPEDRYEIALRYLQTHPALTNRQYRDLTGTSERTALRDLEGLVERGALRAVGNKRGRRYVR